MQHEDDLARLRRHGHRLTPQRTLVLDVLKQSHRHLTAEEIHATVLVQHPYVNITTIYRTLQWLQEVELVAPIWMGNEPLRYEYVRGSGHHHLLCQTCGAQQEVSADTLDVLKTHLFEQYGFIAQLHHLGLPGRCANCRKQADEVLAETEL